MNIQDLIELKAQQELEQQISANEAAAIGASVLGIGGLTAGHGLHKTGKRINKVKDKLAANRGLTRSKAQRLRGAVRPGFRPAGTLAGVLAGGGLGVGIQQLMKQASPAADLLAKYNAGTFTESDALELEYILKQMYSDPNTYGIA